MNHVLEFPIHYNTALSIANPSMPRGQYYTHYASTSAHLVIPSFIPPTHPQQTLQGGNSPMSQPPHASHEKSSHIPYPRYCGNLAEAASPAVPGTEDIYQRSLISRGGEGAVPSSAARPRRSAGRSAADVDYTVTPGCTTTLHSTTAQTEAELPPPPSSVPVKRNRTPTKQKRESRTENQVCQVARFRHLLACTYMCV